MTHEEFVQNVMTELAYGELSLTEVQQALFKALHSVELKESCQDMIPMGADKRAVQIRKFLACKTVEGCTERTIKTYAQTIYYFMIRMPKPFEEISTDDLRFFLATLRSRNLKDTSVNNFRLVLSTLFSWLSANGITQGNPMQPIKRFKTEKLQKKPFSPIEMEWLRVGCRDNLRDTAILEMLASTGCRVEELVEMNRDNVFEDEVIVYGKGKKERRAFINARAKVALIRYLATRDDENPALFVTLYRPHARLKASGVEIRMRELGLACGIADVHPHRFRRTAATQALQRGMPIEVVKDMLGHESINTTLIYAKIADDAVKQAHKRLM